MKKPKHVSQKVWEQHLVWMSVMNESTIKPQPQHPSHESTQTTQSKQTTHTQHQNKKNDRLNDE